MTNNVAAIYGGPTGQREVNEHLVEELTELLEKAKSGEVIGAAVAMLHYDRLTSYTVAGFVGGYGLIGAIDMAKDAVKDVIRS